MDQPDITLYGLANSAEAYTLRDFLTRSGVAFAWKELTSDEEARTLARVDSLSDDRLPVCVLKRGSVLFKPTTHDLACAFDWFRGPKLERYDLAIFGAGPAGLSAAVYGASEGLNTIVIERSAVGGQAGSTSRIDNYLGFPDGISGWELASRARRQAQRLGAEIIVTDEGMNGHVADGWMFINLASGKRVTARATICATGVEYRKLGIPGEERFLNHGVYYGAGSSEAGLCTGQVFVVGGGNSAGQAALSFSRHAETVTMLVRGASLAATLSAYLLESIQKSPNIEVRTGARLIELKGGDRLESIIYETNEDHKPT
jgi:thioredoxin reductase (NADPH)